ncbi:MAG: T9SS type A sorting domain-containing protein [Bacteroidetes bacterium]|nr:T9SS type A sorting domain-containing protein [Bacteroidota bacterium]
MKYILSVLLAWPMLASAQITNNFFEDGNPTSITGWTVNNGSGGSVSEYTLVKTGGDTTIKAFEGSKFAALVQDDNQQTKATTAFALDKRKSTITGQFIYIPTDFTQRFSFNILYTKYSDGKRDTVAHDYKEFTTIDNEGNNYYNWLYLIIRMDDEDFIPNGDPDTCFLEITLDAQNEKKGAILLMDDFNYTDRVVSNVHIPICTGPVFQAYPNPFNHSLYVDLNEGNGTAQLVNSNGLVISEEKLIEGTNQLSTSHLPSGIYYLRVKATSANETSVYKVLKQ